MTAMLGVAVVGASHATQALRDLDGNVFEPLGNARSLKDGITLFHARLFALLSKGANESDAAAQQAAAQALPALLARQTAAAAALGSELRGRLADADLEALARDLKA